MSARSTLLSTSYDEVPYESHSFPLSHPNHLATVATLFGLRPPPVPKARILEMGCASGGNLLPIAMQFPDTQCVGVDLSARQIGDGQATLDAVGLGNARLVHASILDVDESYGQFDYIICHGVYSWVTDEVQKGILDVIAARLAPRGVAYVSYNTYPGWRMRQQIRDMMLYHCAKFTNPAERVRQARAVLDFMTDSTQGQGGAFEALLRQEVEGLRRSGDHYLYHEHLEEVNQPVYFHEFAARAEASRLRYLGEARVGTMFQGGLGEGPRQALRFLAADQIQAEQYMDFLRNRTFRQTLLCHPDAPVNWSLRPEALRGLHVASGAAPITEAVPLGAEQVGFMTPGGVKLASGDPMMKAAMLCLRDVWPQSIPFGVLVEEARRRLGGQGDREADARALASAVLNGHLAAADMIELRAYAFAFVKAAGDRPAADALARRQAAAGRHVTNRRHETVGVEDMDRRVLALLDGSLTREGVLDGLCAAAKAGGISVVRGGEEVSDPLTVRETLAPGLDVCLERLARMSLLAA